MHLHDCTATNDVWRGCDRVTEQITVSLTGQWTVSVPAVLQVTLHTRFVVVGQYVVPLEETTPCGTVSGQRDSPDEEYA